MTLDQLLDLCDLLDRAGVPSWVAGGWGVDVLAGEQTREHQDVDIAVDATRLDSCLAVLADEGFVVQTDWLPVRVQLTAPDGRSVDVHPVVFDDDGDGVQAGPAGTEFRYPAADLVAGVIAGRVVPCISASLQRKFHSGYEPRAVDVHDLAVLDRVTEH